MSKLIRVKEVFGFNGMPYSDYNRKGPEYQEIWFFTIMWNDIVWGFNSRCHLDEKHLLRVETSHFMTDEIVDLLAQWLLEN